MSGNEEFMISLLKEVRDSQRATDDQRMVALERLFRSIETTLADLLEAIESGRDATKDKQEIKAIVEAIGKIRMSAPDVRVDVNPTPVTVQNKVDVSPTPVDVHVEAVMPAQPAPNVAVNAGLPVGAKLELRIPGAYGNPGRTVTVTRTE